MKIKLAGGSSNGSAAWCDDLTMSTVNPASPTLTWGQSFGFDGFGNLLSQTPTAGSTPRLNMTVNTATNQLTATGVQYDSNGNLINNGSSAFTFDLMGRLKTARNSSYTYSAGENKRIAVYYPGGSGGGTMTFYLYGPDGKRLGVYQESSPNGNWNWANVSYPAPQTFQYLGGKALNYSEDRLSSNGNRYYPYGQAYNGTSQGETPTFGTYVPDQGSAMLYADQRYYNAAWGRFLTPDPSDGNIAYSTPGTWNRYSYVNGDPINIRDRRGLYIDAQDCINDPDACLEEDTGSNRWQGILSVALGGLLAIDAGGGGGDCAECELKKPMPLWEVLVGYTPTVDLGSGRNSYDHLFIWIRPAGDTNVADGRIFDGGPTGDCAKNCGNTTAWSSQLDHYSELTNPAAVDFSDTLIGGIAGTQDLAKLEIDTAAIVASQSKHQYSPYTGPNSNSVVYSELKSLGINVPIFSTTVIGLGTVGVLNFPVNGQVQLFTGWGQNLLQ